MSVLKVTGVTDLAGLGGFTLSSGSITANGTLKVNNININGSISGSSKYNIPSFSGQSGQFLSTNGTDLVWSTEISSGGGGGAGLRSMQVFTSNGTWSRPSGVGSIQVVVVGAGGGGSGCVLEPVLNSSGTVTSITVKNPGTGYDTFRVILYKTVSNVVNAEIVEYTTVTSSGIEGCTRAVLGTAQSYSANDLVYFDNYI